MLHFADPAMWSTDAAQRATLVMRCRRGSTYVTVQADGWSDATAVSVSVSSPFPSEVTLRTVGSTVIAVCRLAASPGNTIRLTAERPAAGLVWRQSAVPLRAGLWQGLLPAGLPPSAQVGANGTADRSAIAHHLGTGDVDAALNELAAGWTGSPDDDQVAATRLLLQDLAAHPMRRSERLGALVAALCDGTVVL